MIKYVIRSIHGFQGISYYSTHKEALNAAIIRKNLTGFDWYVTAIKVG